MEKETPVETASAPDAATTQANTEPRSDSIPAPDTTEKAASNPAPNAAASAAGAGDEEDSDWEELDGMGNSAAYSAMTVSQCLAPLTDLSHRGSG